jgi:hypothetical protein
VHVCYLKLKICWLLSSYIPQVQDANITRMGIINQESLSQLLYESEWLRAYCTSMNSLKLCKYVDIHFLWWLLPLGHRQSLAANGQHFHCLNRKPGEEVSCLIHFQALPLNCFQMADQTSQWLGHAEVALVRYLQHSLHIHCPNWKMFVIKLL